MKTEAAILIEIGKPLEIVDLEIPVLKAGQVLVEVMYSGVCHTQLLESRGYRGEDKFLPHCLGHEGSGIVREIGPEVKKVKAGERVILSWIKGSGADIPGATYRWGDKVVNAGGITTFSRYAVVSENRLTIIPEGVSDLNAALVGCAVPTGMGAVFNTLGPKPGSSMVVFGTGGVGLFALAAAAIAGCVPLVAVDVQPQKLEIAQQLGATHCLNALQTDVMKEIRMICPSGADYAVEASGRPDVMRQALEIVRSQGGTAVVIGNAHFGEKIELDPKQLNQGKKLLGTWGGDNQPDTDYPRYCNLMKYQKVNLNPFTASKYSLPNINQALEDLEAGQVVRPIIEISLE